MISVGRVFGGGILDTGGESDSRVVVLLAAAVLIGMVLARP